LIDLLGSIQQEAFEESVRIARFIAPLVFIILLVAIPVRIYQTIRNKFSKDPAIRNKMLDPGNEFETLLLCMLGTAGYWWAWIALVVWFLIYKIRLNWRNRNNEQTED